MIQIDPLTGQPVAVPDSPADVFTMTTAAPPVDPMVQTMAPAMPGAAPVDSLMGRAPWKMAPPEGFLRRLLMLQQARPDVFARLMEGQRAQRFGITPENLGTMQSRQDLRRGFEGGFGAPQTSAVMPVQQPVVSDLAPPMPAAPVAPAAPQGGGWGFGGGFDGLDKRRFGQRSF